MPLEHEGSDFHGERNFIDAKGKYHLVVVGQDENAKTKDDKPLDGFHLAVKVLAGPAGQDGKSSKLLVGNAKSSDKDGGRFRRRIRSRVFVATNLLRPSDVGKPASIDLAKAVGHQFFAELDVNEKGFVDIDADKVFHIDDPDAAAFPRAENYIKQIGSQFRLKPEDFPKRDTEAKANGNGSSASTPAAPDPFLANL